MSLSSKTSSGQILASWTNAKLLGALTELANIRDDAGATRFLRGFPNFLTFKLGPDWTLSKELSGIIREIWHGTADGMRLLFPFLVLEEHVALQTASALRQMRLLPLLRADEKNIRLTFGEAAEQTRTSLGLGDGNPGDDPILNSLASVSMDDLLRRFQPDWTRLGRFRYDAATPLQKSLYLLWQKSSLAKICRNPDCPAPFFIARKVQQQYCGDECAAPFRLEAKLKWWNSVGKKRREKTSSRRTRKEK